MSKPIRIGVFTLGNENVEVIADPERIDARVCLAPEDGPARMTIGIGCDSWGDVVERLVHEAMEMAMIRSECAFNPLQDDDEYSVANRLFVMDHSQFDMAARKVGYFIAAVLPDLSKVCEKRFRR